MRCCRMPSKDTALTYLSDFSTSDKPWDTHKRVNLSVANIYSLAGLGKYALRLAQCGCFLDFGFQDVGEGELKLKLSDAHFCRVRLCPICQWRRSMKWKARFFGALPNIRGAYPTHRFIFLTLTLPNCPVDELKSTLTRVNKAWTRLTQRRSFPAIGWVKSIEITRRPNNFAHPHIHAVLMVPSGYFSGAEYLSQKKWGQLWAEALRVDYPVIIDVRAVGKKNHSDAELVNALKEVLKYGVKEEDLTSKPDEDEGKTKKSKKKYKERVNKNPDEEDVQWLVTLTEQLHKCRMVAVGGVLKDFVKDVEKDDDLIKINEDEESSSGSHGGLNAKWKQNAERYIIF